MSKRSAALLFAVFLFAGWNTSQAQQSVTITTVDGVSVPPDQIYVPYPQDQVFTVEWSAIDGDCGSGVQQMEVYVDGMLQPSIVGTGFSGSVTLDQDNFPSQNCLHTIQISARFLQKTVIPPSCAFLTTPKYSQTADIWSTPYKSCTGPDDCNKGTVGRPVDVATGKMYHEMVDLRIQGPLPIEFLRRYDSQSTYDGALGFGWQHAYQMRIESDGNRQVLVDARGRRVYFAPDAQGAWQENRIEHLVLTAPGTPTWRVTDKQQTKYEFDGAGQLTQIVDRNGNTLTFGYTGANLTSITDPFGRAMALTYDGSNRVQTLSAGGRTVTYTYDMATSNLERVDWSDSSFVTYEYNDPNEPGVKHNLTAARDSYGQLIEGHGYDGSDRVTSTQSDGGNYAYTITYDSATQTTVTNSLAVDTVFTHDSFSGLVTASDGPECSSCGAGGVSTIRGYDAFLNLTSVTDALGIVTSMTHDGNGNVLTRTEADGVGPPVERTWTFTWHPTFNFLASETIPSVGTCANPDKVTTYTYDGATGDRLTEQVTGCAGPDTFSRTTTWTYDNHGQVATVDGPRTDVTDVTTYDYYADGDPDFDLRGRLELVTNALNHETTYAGYDLFGNVGSVTDPNNVETTYLYDEKDRVTETRIHAALPADDIVTEQVYDLEGNLDYVRLPNCVETGAGCAFSTDYTYDTVNRLTEVIDPFGNKIVYTYDTEGNRTREEYRDASAAVQAFTNFAYDDFNRLGYTYFTSVVPEDPGSVFFKNSYYDDGTLMSEQDPEGHVTEFGYDELKRLAMVTQTVGVDMLTTQYGYDHQDNLSSVTDPSSVVTTYTNHDMGWRLQAVSPDTGTTDFEYDPAGNLTSTTDANAVTTDRTYDALDRLMSISYPDAGLNVTQSYDSLAVTYGVGRRTGMIDASGSSVYGYDRRGLPDREEKTIDSETYVTQFAYDKTGNLEQILYPTNDPGQRQGQVDYTYDAADRVSGISAMINGSPATVASSFSYEPFGPRTNLTFGNGLTDSRTYGTRYQLGNWTVGALLDHTHVFDDDLNLTSRIDNLNAANNRTFGYDEIHRLVGASGPWGAGTGCTGGATYTYDNNGNRLCKGEQAPATTYSYVAGTNLLDSSTGGEGTSYNYDDNGNTIGDGSHAYEYNDADRLETVDSGATATYTYDGDGRRVIKATGTSTFFFYDPWGRLLSEVTPDPRTGKEYIYTSGEPVARVDWTTEQDLGGNVLRVGKNPPNVRLDWSLFPAAANEYVVRRKQVVDPGDKTFDGSAVIATVNDPTQVYDDPVLTDGNDYDYRVFRLEVANTLYFYHSDHLSTPITVTDGAGDFVWRAEYDPFGGIHSVPVSSVASELRFAGQYEDEETGLYQNWFRDYRPTVGRYNEPDPLLLSVRSSTNKYAYVDSRPTFSIDPTGLVSSAADCSRCCTNQEFKRELDRSREFLERNWKGYFFAREVCTGGSCGTAADRLRFDLEANVSPKCWITSTQLTTNARGRAFRQLIGDPLGLEGPLKYGFVHYLVKYQPCGLKAGLNYYFDAYTGPRFGVLKPTSEIE